MGRAVTVVGAGVNGLTCGVVLQEAGFEVTLVAELLPPHTTSDLSAAIWYPYKALPVESVRRWSEISFHHFSKLSLDPTSGVSMTWGEKWFHRPMGDPWWKPFNPSFSRPGSSHSGIRSTYRFQVPIIDMSHYLPHFLLPRFLSLGGRIIQKKLEKAVDETNSAFALVNCTGLGAKELVGDLECFPIRGQVLKFPKANITEFLMDTDHPLGMVYVIPRINDCIVGGSSDKNNNNAQASPKESEEIHFRASQILPSLRSLTPQTSWAGLRPGRTSVRLEVEANSPLPMIHNYGHGGSGVTTSWGCAEDVLALLKQLSPRRNA